MKQSIYTMLTLLRYKQNIGQIILYLLIPLQVGGVALPKAMTGWLRLLFVRYLIGGAILILLLTSPLLADDTVTTKLPNGMQVAVRKTADSNVALFIYVRTGAIHEDEYLGHGISHFAEHVISGGTTSLRTEKEYEEIYKRIGAVKNASTAYDWSNYRIIVDADYVDIALEVLSETVMYCIFDPEEVTREQGVITQEIMMRSTPPRSQMSQRMMEVAYPNTHYRYPIIGFPQFFQNVTREDLINYYNKRYTPYNMIFVAVGGFEDTDEMISKIAHTFKDFYRPPAPEIIQPVQPQPPSTYTVTEEFDIEQATVYMIRQMPVDKPADSHASIMAGEILFGKRTAPISHFLVEDRKLVNYIYAQTSYSPLVNRADIMIVFEPKNVADIDQIIAIIDEKLTEYTRPRKITQRMLDEYIKAREASLHLRSENVTNIARNIGSYMIRFNSPDYTGHPLTELKKVTIADVQRVLAEHYLGNKVIFCALPRGTQAALNRTPNTEHQTPNDAVRSDIQRLTINDRLTLLYKHSTEKPIVRATISIPSGANYEDTTNAGTISAMAALLFRGSKKYAPLHLSDWLENRAIELYASVGGTTFNIHFSCLVEDLDPLSDIIIDALTNPLFDENEITLRNNRLHASLMRGSSAPQNIHRDFRNKVLYANPRDQMTELEKYAITSQLTRADLQAIHRKYITADKVTISVFGDIDENRAKRLAQNLSSKIPNRAVQATRTTPEVAIADSIFINTYAHDQVNIDINLRAPNTTDWKDFITMLTIEKIFGSGGMRGRIYNAVRKDNDLVYFAFPTYGYTTHYGFFSINTQTSIDRKDELIAVLIEEINKIKTEPVSETEINEAIVNYAKVIRNQLNESDWVRVALNNETRGLGYDFLETSVAEMYKVTSEDILQVANKYFDKLDIIVSQPNATQ